jgi:hypothetical protein
MPHHGELNTTLLARMMVKAAVGPYLNCRRYDHCSRLWKLYRESSHPEPSARTAGDDRHLLPHKCERARKLVESADCELLQAVFIRMNLNLVAAVIELSSGVSRSNLRERHLHRLEQRFAGTRCERP